MTQGKCNLCDSVFAKAAMTKHLKGCREKQEADREASGRKGKETKLLHLTVQGSYLPEYWMHLEIPASATLGELDGFLRDLWLECCGHLSAFTIGGTRYAVQPMRELQELSMKAPLSEVLGVGTEFTHEYDYGTTTHLSLKAVSERTGETRGSQRIFILARNLPPEIPCESCGKPATEVCSFCIDEEVGWVCEDCAESHDCGEEGLLPVANSPRVGQCGYTGEA